MQKTFEKLEKYQNLEVKKQAYELGYILSKKLKQYEQALSYLERYVETNEQLFSEKSMAQLHELEVKYASLEKAKTIASLELKQQSDTLALIQYAQQRNSLVFLLVLVMMSAGFFYYRSINRKRTGLILAAKNEQIQKALEERETLLKEIHHRVKNNLQVVSSLLNLQAEMLDDEKAINAVKEGQSRVRSMALIHQKLYQVDDVRGVNAAGYFEQLTQELLSTYGLADGQVMVEVLADDLVLDVDTIIPLGLIMNELIINAIKYAFLPVQSGYLKIGLAEQNGQLIATISDSGSGLAPELIEKSTGFGWKLINSLKRKLKADVTIDASNGSQVTLSINRYKLIT